MTDHVLPDSTFRSLDPNEEKEFREWARATWRPGDPINPTWHPVVRDEIQIMQKETNDE